MTTQTGSTTDPGAHPLAGTPVVAGIAAGPAVHVTADVSPEAVVRFGDGGFASEAEALAAYDEAVAFVAETFVEKAGVSHGAAAEVLTASAGLVRDKGLRSAVVTALGSGGGPVAAVRAAVEQFVAVFTTMGGLMAERATDLRDIERRLVARLVGEPDPGVPTPLVPSVLVASDLAPSDTSGLDPDQVVALVTERGGPTSHTAIIARQLGIPCVVGVAGASGVVEGEYLLVDGGAGTIVRGADPVEARALVDASRAERELVDAWTGPAATADGVRLQLLANVADGASSLRASDEPVDGVGLFRTELCFLDRAEEPGVDEQADIYAAVLDPFRARGHVVVRTLDAGSDKPIAFATHEGEENPALGVRGLRLSFGNPGLMERQLDAIARAAERTGADAWVMAPMVATVAEAEEFAGLVRGRGLKAGVMVEVPSAALLAHQMLEVVDFLSIGTNDLTQYTLAADRMATDLAHLTDPWQPAVLQLIAITAHAGVEAGKPVGVCGEAAADPLLATALVGMGVTSLSMAARAVRSVGSQLSRVTLGACEAAAEAALSARDPQAGRQAVRRVLAA